MAAAAGDKTDWDSRDLSSGVEAAGVSLSLAALLDAGLTLVFDSSLKCVDPSDTLWKMLLLLLYNNPLQKDKSSIADNCAPLGAHKQYVSVGSSNLFLMAANTWICELFTCICASWVTWSYLSGVAPCHRRPLAKSACVRWLCHCDLTSVRGCRATHWHSRLQACLAAWQKIDM